MNLSTDPRSWGKQVSKKKWYIGGLLSGLIVAAIVFGATSNFFGSFWVYEEFDYDAESGWDAYCSDYYEYEDYWGSYIECYDDGCWYYNDGYQYCLVEEDVDWDEICPSGDYGTFNDYYYGEYIFCEDDSCYYYSDGYSYCFEPVDWSEYCDDYELYDYGGWQEIYCYEDNCWYDDWGLLYCDEPEVEESPNWDEHFDICDESACDADPDSEECLDYLIFIEDAMEEQVFCEDWDMNTDWYLNTLLFDVCESGTVGYDPLSDQTLVWCPSEQCTIFEDGTNRDTYGNDCGLGYREGFGPNAEPTPAEIIDILETQGYMACEEVEGADLEGYEIPEDAFYYCFVDTENLEEMDLCYFTEHGGELQCDEMDWSWLEDLGEAWNEGLDAMQEAAEEFEYDVPEAPDHWGYEVCCSSGEYLVGQPNTEWAYQVVLCLDDMMFCTDQGQYFYMEDIYNYLETHEGL